MNLKGKTLVIFGDSRTWYNGEEYISNTKEEFRGKKCIGYQQTLAEKLECEIISQGVSGDTSAMISDRVRQYDFSQADVVLLEGGVNDFVRSRLITTGAIATKGSKFDTSTSYGAWQSAVEYIQSNYPNVVIITDTPIIAWMNGEVLPKSIAYIKSEVAELYDIPCFDLYASSGINEGNRDEYYADDVSLSGFHLHFNDVGNRLFGERLAECIESL